MGTVASPSSVVSPVSDMGAGTGSGGGLRCKYKSKKVVKLSKDAEHGVNPNDTVVIDL